MIGFTTKEIFFFCLFVCFSVIAEVQFPVHLLCDWPPLISMDDLHRLKKGQLINQTKAVLQATVSHCEEMTQNEKSILSLGHCDLRCVIVTVFN